MAKLVEKTINRPNGLIKISLLLQGQLGYSNATIFKIIQMDSRTGVLGQLATNGKDTYL